MYAKIFACTAALLASGLADRAVAADSYPPQAVMAALAAQAGEIPTGRLENCTPGGIAAATDEANKEVAAADWGRLAQVQHDYAIGFARCALGASYPPDFYTFACATSVSLANALFGVRQSIPKVDQVQKIIASRARTLAVFLVGDPSTVQEQKDQQVGVLNMLTNMGV